MQSLRIARNVTGQSVAARGFALAHGKQASKVLLAPGMDDGAP